MCSMPHRAANEDNGLWCDTEHLARAFSCFARGPIADLLKMPRRVSVLFLPALLRLTSLAPEDDHPVAKRKRNATISCQSASDRQAIHSWLLKQPEVNRVASLASIDFAELAGDLIKEMKLRAKALSLSPRLDPPPVRSGIRFEQGTSVEKFRLILSEVLYLILWETEGQVLPPTRCFEPFDNWAYVPDAADVLSVALASDNFDLIQIERLCIALLRYSTGPAIIQRVLCNFPIHLPSVCEALLEGAESQDEDGSVTAMRRSKSLLKLCELDPAYAQFVRQQLITRLRLPGLLLRLSLMAPSPLEDTISTLSTVLRAGNNAPSRVWMNQHFLNSYKVHSDISSLSAMKKVMFGSIGDLCRSRLDGAALRDDKTVVEACSLLKAFCILKCLGNIRMSENEIDVAGDLLCSCVEGSSVGTQFICFGLAVLCACPSMLGVSGNPSAYQLERRVANWLSWLMKTEGLSDLEETIESSAASKRGYEDMLLLMALHFHSQQFQQLTRLVTSVLGIKVQIRPNNITKLKTMFTQEIFPESAVAAKAACVPVTTNLNANIAGYLPVHCVQQLLKSRIFTKHKVIIKNWIVKQLRACSLPLHPVIPSLIDAYVRSCLNPLGGNQEQTNHPIEESELQTCFNGDPTDESMLTFRVLLLYYILLYEDIWPTQVRNVTGGKDLPNYSSELLENVPIRYIMQRVGDDAQAYSCIYPQLLKLATTHYQYLFVVQEPLSRSACSGLPLLDGIVSVNQTVDAETFGKVISEAALNAPRALVLLRVILHCKPPSVQISYLEPLTGALPALLDDSVPNQVLVAATEVWACLEKILPRKLYRLTVTALLHKTPSRSLRPIALAHSDICDDPLLVLRCDERVFRCAPILELVLRMLSCYLMASRMKMQRSLMTEAPQPPTTVAGGPLPPGTSSCPNTEGEELVNALVGAQESTAVQIMLEACLPSEDEKQGGSALSTLREVRCLICSHLHQIFIAGPVLMKLVHFQGYHHDLLNVTVSGIPSMHICLDFIPEMFQQPDPAKQMFAFDLLSHLSEQYTIPKALSCARLGVNVINTQLIVLTTDQTIKIFSVTLPAFLRIARVFPPLVPEIVAILFQVARICASRLALTSQVLSPLSPDWSFRRITTAEIEALIGGRGEEEEAVILFRNLAEAFRTDLPESVIGCTL